MKQSNNVFRNVGYRPLYCLRHPLYWLRQKSRQFKWAYQRVKYGWAESDAWDIDDWFIKTVPQMLRHMAYEGHSYPGNEEFPTFTSWQQKLVEVANDIEASDEEYMDMANEYYKDYMDELKNWQYDNRTLMSKTEVQEKYFARRRDLAAEADVRLKRAFDFILKNFHHLWD